VDGIRTIKKLHGRELGLPPPRGRLKNEAFLGGGSYHFSSLLGIFILAATKILYNCLKEFKFLSFSKN
jgi:hypothetical protein